MVFNPDSLRELEKEVPEKLTLENYPEMERETRRLYFIGSFISLAIEALEDGSVSEARIKPISRAMSTLVEGSGGGTVSEAMTRLMGMGIMEDFPEIEKRKNRFVRRYKTVSE